MSRATHARFLARQAERRAAAKVAAVPPCSACNATVGQGASVHRYVADDDLLGMFGSVWMCDSCVDPELVRERISREIAEKRAKGQHVPIR